MAASPIDSLSNLAKNTDMFILFCRIVGKDRRHQEVKEGRGERWRRRRWGRGGGSWRGGGGWGPSWRRRRLRWGGRRRGRGGWWWWDTWALYSTCRLEIWLDETMFRLLVRALNTFIRVSVYLQMMVREMTMTTMRKWCPLLGQGPLRMREAGTGRNFFSFPPPPPPPTTPRTQSNFSILISKTWTLKQQHFTIILFISDDGERTARSYLKQIFFLLLAGPRPPELFIDVPLLNATASQDTRLIRPYSPVL